MSQPEQIKIYGGTDLASKVSKFNKQAESHDYKQKLNPFSGHQHTVHKLAKTDLEYGKPVAGSKTDQRGKKANQLINEEVYFLCTLIWEYGERNEADGTAKICFGELFQMYTKISNKVVGILLRARKHNLVDFEGEMLYQRRDDNVIISLLKPIQQIQEARKQLTDPSTLEDQQA